MRDYLLFYVNGKECRVSGDEAFQPLSSFLRLDLGATGTKVVCEEGDCGACSIILGRMHNGEIRYRPVNSCIQFLYQLDCTHIVTVEGLKYNDKLNPIQESMVKCHGAQCGYCTPGFIVAMCAMFDCKSKSIEEQDIKDGLTGNLCRCTGYEPIIKAGLEVDTGKLLKLHELYPSKDMQAAFDKHSKLPIEINTANHSYCNPVELKDAAKFKSQNAGTTIVSGGTDVCVYWNKREIKPKHLMSVSNLPDMQGLEVKDGTLVVGAKTSLSELEDFTKEKLPELNHILWLFGSPQIRNAGTLAGNIANGSPIADSLPFLHVMEAELELFGLNGTRRVNINQFYQGYKKMDIAADELIVRIHIPIPTKDEVLRLYKVSKRKHLDISAFTAAFKFKVDKGTIQSISIAYGGVGPVILRLKKTEEFLKGKQFDLPTLQEAGRLARTEITPISDVRGSSDFRNQLAENIMQKLFYECESQRAVACQP